MGMVILKSCMFKTFLRAIIMQFLELPPFAVYIHRLESYYDSQNLAACAIYIEYIVYN